MKLRFNERATDRARKLLSELKLKYRVDFPIREPVVYTCDTSRTAELLKFAVLDFLLWPFTLGRRSPSLGSYGSFLSGVVPAIVTLNGDRATLEHEVRHHFSYEVRRHLYSMGQGLSFLREYCWEESHQVVAGRKLEALHRREISTSKGSHREAALLLEGLSLGSFPESWLLPDALASIVAEAAPWVGEGFASEGSLFDLARLPVKLVLSAATLGLLYTAIPVLLSASFTLALTAAYLLSGVVKVSYSFLRTLPLDFGVLRWRRLREDIDDSHIPILLAFPPTGRRTPSEIISAAERRSIL